jgi:hypothetical protein
MARPTLPGYRVRAGSGPWRDVRCAHFVIGSSPRADLVIAAAAPRHLRIELGVDGAVVRALDGPITVGGVPVLAAPVGDADVTVDGALVRIERAAPWAPPAGGVDGLEGCAPLRRLAIAALAATDEGPLLIEGEPGTGRTTAARAVAGAGCVEVDCREALDELEPQLFGSAMARLGRGDSGGAFAAGGALILDAVDELDPSLHTRLIAALDRHPDVRVIAVARDLDGSDLSAPLQDRLAVRRAWLPPLAAMPEDILPFARRFAADVDPDAELPRDLPRILGARPWRRNLAELRAFMSRLVRL